MASTERSLSDKADSVETETLFDQCSWFYAMCREHLFRDHTSEIVRALFPTPPSDRTVLLELGCGPGFYARRLAQLFPQLNATGVDLSGRLIRVARLRAASRSLHNCSFRQGDAQALPELQARVEAIVVSRLFLIVPHKGAVLSEVFRVLRPGGRCFIVEPTSVFRTSIPLFCMWILAGLRQRALTTYREPHQVQIMSRTEFAKLIHSQPWASVKMVDDGWYQYAVCTKALEEAVTGEASEIADKSIL